MSYKIVDSLYGYDIEETNNGDPPGKVHYNVWKGDELVFGNRRSLEEARRDLDMYSKHGDFEDFGTLESLLKSKTYQQGWDIDPGIKSLIWDLNHAGFRTLGSCQGHGGKYGFITFDPKTFNWERDSYMVRQIFEDNGVPKPFKGSVEPNYVSVHFKAF